MRIFDGENDVTDKGEIRPGYRIVGKLHVVEFTCPVMAFPIPDFTLLPEYAVTATATDDEKVTESKSHYIVVFYVPDREKCGLVLEPVVFTQERMNRHFKRKARPAAETDEDPFEFPDIIWKDGEGNSHSFQSNGANAIFCLPDWTYSAFKSPGEIKVYLDASQKEPIEMTEGDWLMVVTDLGKEDVWGVCAPCQYNEVWELSSDKSQAELSFHGNLR